jgi:predicted Zn-dependent protease
MRQMFFSISNTTLVLAFYIGFYLSGISLAIATENLQQHYDNALNHFQQNRFDESMSQVKKALKANPNDQRSKILLGKLLVKNNDLQAAKIQFSEAIDLGASVNLFAGAWGYVLMELKSYQSIIHFKQYSDLTKLQHIEWQRLRATACILVKNYNCAKQSFSKVGQLSGNKTEQLNGHAHIAFSQNKYQLAQTYLQQAIQVNPSQFESWWFKGFVAKHQNSLNLTLIHLQIAFELAPDSPYVFRDLVDAYVTINKDDAAKETINSLLNPSIDNPFNTLDYQRRNKSALLKVQTEKKFQELGNRIHMFPADLIESEPSLLFLRALLAFRKMEYEEVMRDLVALQKLGNASFYPYILLAKSYIALDKPKNAIEVLEKNQQELAEFPDILVSLGDLYIKAGKNFKALTVLEELQATYPGNVQVKLLDAKLSIARRKVLMGLKKLNSLLLEYPLNEVVLFNHSKLNLQTSNYLKANESITQLLKLKPDVAIYHSLQSTILLKLNDTAKAKEHVIRAIELKPKLVSAKFTLAVILESQNQTTPAVTLLNDLVQQHPTYQPALLLLAKIQLGNQQLDEAQKNYRQVLEDNKQNIEALEGLVTIHTLKEENRSALFQLSKLAKIQSENPHYMIQKAKIYMALNDRENSQREINTLSQFTNNDATLMLALSHLHFMNNDVLRALESVDSIQKIHPKQLSTSIQLIELLLSNQLNDRAEMYLETLLKTFKGSTELQQLQVQLKKQQSKTT